VVIQPGIGAVRPLFNKCYEVSPRQDTTYSLRATGLDGRQERISLTIRVKPAPPEFVLFATSEREFVRGQRFTLCYCVVKATAVRLEPFGMSLPAVAKNCRMFYPSASADIVLTATGKGGTIAQIRTRITVLPRRKAGPETTNPPRNPPGAALAGVWKVAPA
jgi:hypothetical protein